MDKPQEGAFLLVKLLREVGALSSPRPLKTTVVMVMTVKKRNYSTIQNKTAVHTDPPVLNTIYSPFSRHYVVLLVRYRSVLFVNLLSPL